MRSSDYLETPIAYLKGVGPQRAETLKTELGIFTFNDLLHHYPFRYIDRSRFYQIRELTEDMPYIQIRGKLSKLTPHGGKRTTRLSASISDQTGSIDLVWFQGIRWLKENLHNGTEYILFGKPTIFNGRINIVHPEIEESAKAELQISGALTGVYATTEKCKAKGLDSKAILKLQKNLLSNLPNALNETLPSFLISKLKLISLREALIYIHLPSDEKKLIQAQRRLKFEELFFIQLKLLLAKSTRQSQYRGKTIGKIGELFNSFYHNHLPFQLTNAQKRVLKEIRSDMGSGFQMNRLLQGDVGSGKTMVALLSMLMVLDENYQACMMAPTEILANQHFESISPLMREIGINTALLTGSTKVAQRRIIAEQLLSGELHILIGTHALIEEKVQFKNLGLVVIDEQHRFGVQQRAKLWMKDTEVPHVLVMTATPIPRTLAMTLYGDLDTSVIDEMPPGRKAIVTKHYFEKGRLSVIGFMKEEIAKGRQIYIVYPLIEESEKSDYMNLMQGYDNICTEFPLPKYKVSIVHGKMKAADKESEMQRFKRGETQLMVATTVIEVGVNVPNASVMIIESSERFGLSQLHQLRGRVGRGAEQSYCILMTGDKLGADARQRIKTMVATNNGFEIAETDLQLRGPGDITGTMQSGVINLRIADLSKDVAIVEAARNEVQAILNKDPNFILPEHAALLEQLKKLEEEQTNFSRVS